MKRRFLKQFSIRNAVERATARHREVGPWNSSMEILHHVKKHFFEAVLHGVGKIHVARRDLGIWFSRGPNSFSMRAEKCRANRTVPSGLTCIPWLLPKRLEIFHVQLKAPFFKVTILETSST